MDLPNTASRPTSRFRFLSEDGTPQEGPREWVRGLITVDCPLESWAQASLERNGVPLDLSQRVLRGSTQVVAEWPLSGTGHFELTLRLADEIVETTTWTVGPGKISPQAYQSLLEDLEAELPVSIALGLQKLGGATGLDLTTPTGVTSIAEEVSRLKRAVSRSSKGPGLAAILREVARDPHEVLTGTQTWVAAERARRVEPSGFMRAIALGSNLDATGIPLRLPDSRVRPTMDVYENRLLKAFVEQVVHRLNRLRAVLERAGHADQLAEAIDLLEQMERARRQAPFLDEVGLLGQTPNRVTMVLAKRPAYRDMLEAFLQFRRRTAVRLKEPALESPLESLPNLYETWGVLHTIRSVLGLAEEEGYTILRDELLRPDPLGAWIEVLPNGRAALRVERHDGQRVSVIHQRVYSATENGMRSVSYTQIPDLAVEVSRPGGETEVFLFDPKYKLDSEFTDEAGRVGKPKKVDIDKMHAYRDAIRDGTGSRVVRFAGILYPGPRKVFADGLMAISAIPGREGELHSELEAILRPALA
jgi:predicted component of viral defense system (DUF524 family)